MVGFFFLCDVLVLSDDPSAIQKPPAPRNTVPLKRCWQGHYYSRAASANFVLPITNSGMGHVHNFQPFDVGICKQHTFAQRLHQCIYCTIACSAYAHSSGMGFTDAIETLIDRYFQKYVFTFC
jgi:hypothetical protein